MSTIFYSWQSDLPNAANRGLIEAALQLAIKQLAAGSQMEVVPVLDRDTLGLPGAPNIADAILAKIDGADVFIADVTPVTGPECGRKSPNPNVLFELGYALKALGSDRVVMVLNTAFGRPEDLPFDLRQKRITTYEMPSKAESRAPERRKLAGILKEALAAALSSPLSRIPLAIQFRNGNKVLKLGPGKWLIEHTDKDDKLASQTIPVQLVLKNTGSEPISDVHCFISVGAGISLRSLDQTQAHWWRWLNVSTAEDIIEDLFPTKRAKSLAEITSEVFGFQLFQMKAGVESGRVDGTHGDPVKPHVNGVEAVFHLRKIKPGWVYELEPLFLTSPEVPLTREITVAARINCDAGEVRHELQISPD